jgi:hypothetical protein
MRKTEGGSYQGKPRVGLRANRQLGGDAGQAATRERLDLLQGGVNLANGSVRGRVDAADTPQAREVRQHEA